MDRYSEQDLKDAAEFREGVHREALAIVRRTRRAVAEVVDRHPAEDYLQKHWDYPGRWYTVVAIPEGYGSRKALVDAIVRATLGRCAAEDGGAGAAAGREPGRRRLSAQLGGRPAGYRELFVVESDPKNHAFRAVGVDDEGRRILEQREEYSRGGAVGSECAYDVLSDAEFMRFARLSLLNGNLSRARYDALAAKDARFARREEEPFYALLAEYPDRAADYCIVKPEGRYQGYASHRAALKTAWQTRFAFDEDGESVRGDPDSARGTRISAEALFAPLRRGGKLNYRGAFLDPPHGNAYSERDFARVNAALFPKGTDALEVYAWTTDWSDYFDDGREWWGTLCLTVYDQSLDRFAVIMASATD